VRSTLLHARAHIVDRRESPGGILPGEDINTMFTRAQADKTFRGLSRVALTAAILLGSGSRASRC
jgi:hypothetical protein